MNNQSSGSGVIIGVLILVVIIIVGWLAYSQGFFDGKDQPKEEGASLQINLGGSSRDAQ